MQNTDSPPSEPEASEEAVLDSSGPDEPSMRLWEPMLWLLGAVVVLAPGVLQPSQHLIGSAEIDVWNHAWGYWYVAQALAAGQWPFHTELVGHPTGGSLYFIDTPGAVLMTPITWALGPAVAYNLMLLFRLATAAYGAQLFARVLSGPGKHTRLAGVAMLTSPFLLCELNNGISEVCGLGAVALLCWAMARVLSNPTLSNWLLVGLFQGLTASATFYYGLITGLLNICFFGIWIGSSFLRKKKHAPRLLLGAIGAAVLAFLIASPHILGFVTSLEDAGSLVRRNAELNEQLVRHNAVDPQIYLRPGHFQSVDLKSDYGEPFLHTAYLRWSVILLVLVALWRHRQSRVWGALSLIALVVGLGPYLWLNGDWIRLPNGAFLSLPFDWLRSALPQIAITHPLRLAVPGLVMLAGLAAIGAKSLKSWQLGALALVIAIEGLFGSSMTWPLTTADARIGSQYNDIPASDSRAVLDLPAEAGTSMRTSQYFWFQTKHERPIPYTPDVRLGSSRDFETFKYFMADGGQREWPQQLSGPAQLHMRKQYARVVVHPQFDAEKGQRYIEVLSAAFGEPNIENDHYWWALKPLSEEDKPPPETTQSAYSNLGDQDTLVICERPERSLRAMMENTLTSEQLVKLEACGKPLHAHCRQQIRSPDIELMLAEFCLPLLLSNPIEGDAFLLTHLFNHPDQALRNRSLSIILNTPNKPQFDHKQITRLAAKFPAQSTELLQLIEK